MSLLLRDLNERLKKFWSKRRNSNVGPRLNDDMIKMAPHPFLAHETKLLQKINAFFILTEQLEYHCTLLKDSLNPHKCFEGFTKL